MLDQKAIIGIDIGSSKIKMIRIDKKGMTNEWAINSIPKDLIVDNRIVSEELLAQHIKTIVKENRIRGKKCSLCLPSQHIITKVIALPIMDKKLLIDNIYYDMGEYLPLNLSKYLIDYKILKTSVINGVEYWNILVIAVLEKIILSYIRVLKKARLNPIYIDAPFNCLQKLLMDYSSNSGQSHFDSGNYCIIDAGYHSINIIIIHKGVYFADRTIPFRGIALKEIIDEIMGVIRYFKNNVIANKQIDNIIMFGGGSMDDELTDELAQRTDIKIILYGDWLESNNIYFNGLGKEELMLMGNAIGSTIRREDP